MPFATRESSCLEDMGAQRLISTREAVRYASVPWACFEYTRAQVRSLTTIHKDASAHRPSVHQPAMMVAAVRCCSRDDYCNIGIWRNESSSVQQPSQCLGVRTRPVDGWVLEPVSS